MRLLYLMFICEGLFIFAYVLPRIHCDCIHDNLTALNISASDSELRQRRDDSENDVLLPLAIHTHMEDIAHSISKNVMFNFKLALNNAVKFLSAAFKVNSSTRPFRLERLNCKTRWTEGENVNKCSSVKPGPEVCSVNSTDHIIPKMYLNRLQVFDKNGSMPIQVFPMGVGAKHSNFILFIISRETDLCSQKGVKAYGSYCRVGYRNRPVAGLINMCPGYFSKTQYNYQYYYNIIMHEMFHILGFSRHLYSEFSGCSSKDIVCEVPKKISKTDSNGIQRLVFPELVEVSKNHYNCSADDFGAPLDQWNSSSSEELSSHWHPLLMYSSIMTPNISEDDFVVIDKITLGLLASTGWYEVNFTRADDFIMGKDGGCDFGFKDECENSTHLCLPSKGAEGCDLWHSTPGKCQQVVSYHPCGVIKPDRRDNCSIDTGKVYDLHPTAIKHQYRCVMLKNDTDAEEKPTCVAMKCLNDHHVRILIESYHWVICKHEDEVYYNNMTIRCPKDITFCKKAKMVIRPFCQIPDYSTMEIEMFFERPTFTELEKAFNFKDFKVQTINTIARRMGIQTSYIFNSSLNVFKDVSLEFVICVPINMQYENLTRAMTRIQKFLRSNSFSYVYKGAVEFPVLSTEFRMRTQSWVSGDFADVQALFIIPAIFVVFFLASLLAVIYEFCSKKKHQPQREMVELQDTEENDSLQEILKRENK